MVESQKKNGPVELCENRLEEPIPTTNDALHVELTPTLLARIKQEGRESATLGTVVFNIASLDVEATIVPMGVVLCRELMYVVG